MSSERADFEATLNMEPVEKSLDTVRAKENAVVGEGSRLEDSLKRIEHASEHAGEKIEHALEGAHHKARALGGGIAALGLAFGDSAEEGGKLVREAGHIAGLFAVAGPWGAAFAVGALAVTQVVEALHEAHEGEAIFSEAVEATNTKIAAQADKALGPMRESLRSLTKELLDYGKTSRQVALDDAMFQQEALKIRKDNLERNSEEIELKQEELKQQIAFGATEDERNLATEQYAGNLAVIEQIEIRAKSTEKAVEEADHNVEGLQEVIEKLDDLDKKALEKKNAATSAALARKLADSDPYGGSVLPQALKAMEDQAAYAAELEESANKAHREAVLDRVKSDVAAAVEEQRLAKQTADAQIREQKRIAEEHKKSVEEQQKLLDQAWGSGFDAVMGNAESAFLGFLDATEKGQKKAAQEEAKAFLESTGKQLIGLGIKNVLEGGAMALGGNPAGAGIAEIGLLELAAGGALYGGGVAIPGVPASSGSRSAAATDRGVNRPNRAGGGAGGGGGGDTNITFVSGAIVGAPPQDQGREVDRVLNARRRAAGSPLQQPERG